MFRFKKREKKREAPAVSTPATYLPSPFSLLNTYTPLKPPEAALYESLREAVPIIDAAIGKIVRLVGTFVVRTPDRACQKELTSFLQEVRAGAMGQGIQVFLNSYLDTMLTYGNAVGEMVLNTTATEIAALFLPSIRSVHLRYGENPLDVRVCVDNGGPDPQPVTHPELVFLSALNPPDSCSKGVPILHSLPFISRVLLTIQQSIQNNFERVGNVRFAVTYKPASGADTARAKERASVIAREWSASMQAPAGQVRDFVAVGDVDIKVIGADNQFLDTAVPIRHILEQIVAKLGLPPFMLGLSWSSTERMSKQQADILTSELESYRNLLNPVIRKICRYWLRLHGYPAEMEICWDTINLQDEIDEAQAELYRAQARALGEGKAE